MGRGLTQRRRGAEIPACAGMTVKAGMAVGGRVGMAVGVGMTVGGFGIGGSDRRIIDGIPPASYTIGKSFGILPAPGVFGGAWGFNRMMTSPEAD